MTDKQAGLEKALALIEKKFKDTTYRGSELKFVPMDFISTGSLALDDLIGGGFPRGAISLLFGDFSTGKSTMCLEAIANVQRAGGAAAYIKLENWLPPDYARAIGVDLDKLILSSPKTGESALEIAETLMLSGEVQIVVVDSIPALIPNSRVEGGIGSKHFGDTANLMNNSLKQLSDAAVEGNCALVFITQTRPTQGATSMIPGYVVTHPVGGWAIKFYSDVIIELVRKFEKETRKEQQFVVARIYKSRVSEYAQSEAKFIIEYGKGINREADLAMLAIDRAIITDKGVGRYEYGEQKWHGFSKLVDAIKSDPALRAELETKCREGMNKK